MTINPYEQIEQDRIAVERERLAMERDRTEVLRGLKAVEVSRDGPICFVSGCAGLAKITLEKRAFCDTHVDAAMKVMVNFTENEQVAEARLYATLRALAQADPA